MHKLDEQAASENIGGDAPLATTDTTITTLWKQKPEGCDDCGHTGFRGRIGIYETLGMSNTIQKLLTSNATSNDIQDESVKEGMLTMQTDGLIKAFRGATTVEEVLRVTREQ